MSKKKSQKEKNQAYLDKLAKVGIVRRNVTAPKNKFPEIRSIAKKMCDERIAASTPKKRSSLDPLI